MTGKNILYVSYDGMTDLMGRSQVLPYLVGLSALGYKFSLISFEKEDRFFKYKEDVEAITSAHDIKWYPMSYTKNPPVLSTVLDINRMRRKAIALHKENNFSLVHCRSYIPSFIGRLLKRKFGVKYVFDTRGLWVDERVQGNLWNLKNPLYYIIYKYFKKQEVSFYESADCTITQANAAMHYLHSWKNIKNQPIPIKNIPCCADMNIFDPASVNKGNTTELRRKLNIDDRDFVIGYCGALGTWYMLKEKLEFFKAFLISKPESKFLIVTPHDQKEIFETAGELNLDTSKLIVREAKREEVPLYMSLFDISIYFIKPAPTNIAKSPIKLGELMGMGIPVITNSGVGDVDNIITGNNAGFIIEHCDQKCYEQAIEAIQRNNFSDRNTIRKAGLEVYSVEKGIQNYFEVYNRLTGK